MIGSGERLFLCGGDSEISDRGTCPHTLHDWPLPSGYIDAHQEASARLGRRWKQARCPSCGLYGWVPGRMKGEVRVPAPS